MRQGRCADGSGTQVAILLVDARETLGKPCQTEPWEPFAKGLEPRKPIDEEVSILRGGNPGRSSEMQALRGIPGRGATSKSEGRRRPTLVLQHLVHHDHGIVRRTSCPPVCVDAPKNLHCHEIRHHSGNLGTDLAYGRSHHENVGTDGREFGRTGPLTATPLPWHHFVHCNGRFSWVAFWGDEFPAAFPYGAVAPVIKEKGGFLDDLATCERRPKARTFHRVCIVAFEGCGVVGSGEVDRVGRLAADLAKWVFRTPLGPVGDQGRRKTG